MLGTYRPIQSFPRLLYTLGPLAVSPCNILPFTLLFSFSSFSSSPSHCLSPLILNQSVTLCRGPRYGVGFHSNRPSTFPSFRAPEFATGGQSTGVSTLCILVTPHREQSEPICRICTFTAEYGTERSGRVSAENLFRVSNHDLSRGESLAAMCEHPVCLVECVTRVLET